MAYDKKSRDFLVQVKDSYNLVELVSTRVTLKHKGYDEYTGRCPFHEEKTSSFHVNKFRYHCFGCNRHGDVFKWVMFITGKQFPQVVELLASKNAIIDTGVKLPQREEPKYSDYNAKAISDIIAANERAGHYYEQYGSMDKTSLEYMKRFGDTFVLYAGPEYDGLPGYLEEHGISLELAKQAGLVSQRTDGSWYSRMRDRCIIPLMSQANEIIGFIGRKIPRPGINDELPKYINPPTSSAFVRKRYLYNLNKATHPSKVGIIVEGPLDALNLEAHGVPNVVASLGCQFTREQASVFFNTMKRGYIMYDNDKAGMKGMLDALRMGAEEDLDIRVVLMTGAKDPGELKGDIVAQIAKFPKLKIDDLFRDTLIMTLTYDKKQVYDRSVLDNLARKYVLANISEGFPQMNCVDWVSATFPEYTEALKEATKVMLSDVDVTPHGTKVLKEEHVKHFISVWKKPCRDVRRKHVNK